MVKPNRVFKLHIATKGIAAKYKVYATKIIIKIESDFIFIVRMLIPICFVFDCIVSLKG